MEEATRAYLAELERAEAYQLDSNDPLVPSGERPCPICGELMEVESMSGVHIDVCGKHGVWLDNGELPSILTNANINNRRRQLEALRNAKNDGKKSGILFGVWSLLFD